MTAILAVLSLPIAIAMALAWMLVISRRAKHLHAMQNQVYSGTPTSRRFVALPAAAANTTFAVAGQPILIGVEPCVTLDAYQSATGGCTCLFNGSFSTTIIARSANSPLVTAQVNPGDKLYYSQGTFDPTTNVTYGGVLDKNISEVPFGYYDMSQTAIPAGTTNTAGVFYI